MYNLTFSQCFPNPHFYYYYVWPPSNFLPNQNNASIYQAYSVIDKTTSIVSKDQQKPNMHLLEKDSPIILEKASTCQSLPGTQQIRPLEISVKDNCKQLTEQTFKMTQKEIKLDYRMQWKNQNRNIVPNLVNQMFSFLLKRNKSHKLIKKLFVLFPHSPSWNENRFYFYMKRIKESVTHYINQAVLQFFMEIHEPNYELYSFEEQHYYMSICRIAIKSFLQNDAILISLTSARMSQVKRKAHLIARDALRRKFIELACYNKH